jgi:hypothetical protein
LALLCDLLQERYSDDFTQLTNKRWEDCARFVLHILGLRSLCVSEDADVPWETILSALTERLRHIPAGTAAFARLHRGQGANNALRHRYRPDWLIAVVTALILLAVDEQAHANRPRGYERALIQLLAELAQLSGWHTHGFHFNPHLSAFFSAKHIFGDFADSPWCYMVAFMLTTMLGYWDAAAHAQQYTKSLTDAAALFKHRPAAVLATGAGASAAAVSRATTEGEDGDADADLEAADADGEAAVAHSEVQPGFSTHALAFFSSDAAETLTGVLPEPTFSWPRDSTAKLQGSVLLLAAQACAKASALSAAAALST